MGEAFKLLQGLNVQVEVVNVNDNENNIGAVRRAGINERGNNVLQHQMRLEHAQVGTLRQ